MKLLPETWSDTIFNLQERFHHTALPGEIDLLRKNELFSKLTEEQFQRVLTKIRLVKYPAETVILKEGEPGYACYIVFEGEVGVFIRNIEGARIRLAVLKQGDYFGEQIIFGDASATRNADVESIAPVTLVYIAKEVLSAVANENPEMRTSLIKRGYNQACNNLSLATGFFNEVTDLIPNVQNYPIIEFKKDDLIFEAGDRPDYVYFILNGEVELVQQSFAERSPTLILHRGLIFGEAAVLGYSGFFKTQRAVSALANTDTRLLAVPGDDFKKSMIGNAQLKLFLSKLQKGYRIPMRGTAEEYFTNIQDQGPAITNIYQLEDGRSVISRLFILQDLFTMYVDNVTDAKHYVYENEVLKLEIDVKNKHLVGIKSTGLWDDISGLCEILLDDEPMDRATFAKLEIIGHSINNEGS